MAGRLERMIQNAMRISPNQFLAERTGKTVEEMHSDLAAAGIMISKTAIYSFLERHDFAIPEKAVNEGPDRNWPPAKSEYDALLQATNESKAIAEIAKKYKVTREQSRNVYDIYFNPANNFRQPVYMHRVLQDASERVSVGIESLLPEHFDRKNGATFQQSFIFKIYLGMTKDCNPSSALNLMIAASKENPNYISEPLAAEEEFEREKIVFDRGTPDKFEYVSPYGNGK